MFNTLTKVTSMSHNAVTYIHYRHLTQITMPTTTNDFNGWWTKLSRKQKMNYAVEEAYNNIHSADVAFHRGLGMLILGKEYLPEAIAAFEKSKKLDAAFTPASNLKLAQIHHQLGDDKMAYSLLEITTALLLQHAHANSSPHTTTIADHLKEIGNEMKRKRKVGPI